MHTRVAVLATIAVLLCPAAASAASWSPQQTVKPGGAVASTFRSVACPTVRFCTAVGATGPTYDPAAPLIERWNGAVWTVDLASAQPGDRTAELRDVACASRRRCLAVGSRSSATGSSAPLAERWDGSRWSALTPAVPPNAVGAVLHGVSCPSARGCVAVGVAYFPAGRLSAPRPLVERWNGSAWAIQPTPDIGSADNSLDDVSCSSADACTAVGYYVRPGGGQIPLVERFDGSAWKVQDTPAIPDQVYNQFTGVSCPRRRYCEAVGTVFTTKAAHGIAERWDGGGWTLESTPGPLDGSQLLGVTCGPRGRCTAVGERLSSPTGNERPLIERRIPAGWRIETTQLPAGGAFGRLWGVSCSGEGNCTAAGWWGNGSPGLNPLAVHRAR